MSNGGRKAFVVHYYHLFDNDRAALSSLYQPNSMMSFEGQKILGIDDILAKLSQLPFDQCRHVISTIDSQPSSSAGGGIVVFVSGTLHLLGEGTISDVSFNFNSTRKLLCA